MNKEPAAVLPKVRKCTAKHFGFRVALVVLGYDGRDLKVLLEKRVKPRSWSLPYRVPALEQSLDDAVHGLRNQMIAELKSSVEQIHTFGPARFKKRRWITTVYSTIIHVKSEGENPSSREWLSIERRPMLTRLEDQIIDKSLEALRKKVRYEPVGFYMLPPEFTLQQLQRMYELLLGQPISKQSFRKKMWESEILIPLEETITEKGRSQPKGLYRFNKKKYFQLKRSGFFLDL